MRNVFFAGLCALCALCAGAEAVDLPAAALLSAQFLPAGAQSVADPFAAAPIKAVLPAPPKALPSLPTGPAVPVASPPPPLPATLRVVLIRAGGQALLSGAEGGASLVVTHGQPVWVAGELYHAEVGPTWVRLYLAPKGKRVWEGGLVGGASGSGGADPAPARYVPPLSAGVNPGRSASASSTASAAGAGSR